MLLDLLFPPACPACGAPGRGPCGPCARALASPPPDLPVPPGLDGLLAATAYAGAARTLLLRAKAGRRDLLAPLADRLAEVVSSAVGSAAGLRVVPVPSHVLARWRRGFDPAAEIARPVAARLGLPVCRDLSRRLRAARPSKGQSVHGRREAVRQAFRATRPLHGARILLVDDVATTGATLAACAAALRASGAAEVRAAVWARTPRGV